MPQFRLKDFSNGDGPIVDQYKKSISKIEKETNSIWRSISNLKVVDIYDFDWWSSENKLRKLDEELRKIFRSEMDYYDRLSPEDYEKVEDAVEQIDDINANLDNKIEKLKDIVENLSKAFMDTYRGELYDIDDLNGMIR